MSDAANGVRWPLLWLGRMFGLRVIERLLRRVVVALTGARGTGVAGRATILLVDVLLE